MWSCEITTVRGCQTRFNMLHDSKECGMIALGGLNGLFVNHSPGLVGPAAQIATCAADEDIYTHFLHQICYI
jgi:hypothetical protein